MAKRAKKRIGGRGSANCANWLTGTEVKLGMDVTKERRRRTLRATGREAVEAENLDRLKAIVAGRFPAFKERAKGGPKKYWWIMKVRTRSDFGGSWICY